jgi:hypothetical protein
MNKYSKILTILFILTGIIFYYGCVKEKFKAPAFTIPHSSLQANTTIKELKKLYAFGGPLIKIPSNVIIEGVVVADDQSGNYYEEIVIQDSTAGIEVLLNQSDLYTQYRIGQRIFINCGGGSSSLYLGSYGGAVQLGCYNGSANNGTLQKIPPVYFNNYLFPDSLPGNPPAPKVLSILTLDSSNIDMLVRFNDVQFVPAAIGQIFAPQTANNTSQTIVDNTGNSLVVYTSKYANFSADTVPSGKGNIIGILTNYKGYELYLRTINDLVPGSGWIFQ